MMRFNVQDGSMFVEAELRDRVGVYLDNDSLIELSKGPAERRNRFVKALHSRGTLLFSLANALEIAGPTNASADAVRAFLDSIGPRWIPLEINPWKVMEREATGSLSSAPVSIGFMDGYFRNRLHDLGSNGSALVDMSSESFFRLGAVLDWVHDKRDELLLLPQELDAVIRQKIVAERNAYETAPRTLDVRWPPVPYVAARPAAFVFTHLIHTLVIEAKAFQFVRNDGIDFCHAVMGAAYGSIATLDKQWKRRVNRLPKPNQLAQMFYRPEIEALVKLLIKMAS